MSPFLSLSIPLMLFEILNISSRTQTGTTTRIDPLIFRHITELEGRSLVEILESNKFAISKITWKDKSFFFQNENNPIYNLITCKIACN